MQLDLTPAERAQAAGNWRKSLAPVYERRTGPRKFAPPATVAPATRWDPVLPGLQAGPARDYFVRSTGATLALPASEADIAFAPLWQLSRWIQERKLTSERLTRLYLDRIERFDAKLRCLITLTRDLALTRAQQADKEIAAGHYRGPLHGIPWGGKDLLGYGGHSDDVRRGALPQPRATRRMRRWSNASHVRVRC